VVGETPASLQGQHDSDTHFKLHPANIDGEESKPLKSGRSWQKYLAPAAKQTPLKIGIPKKKVFVGKENVVLLSKPSSVMKKKSSKIQTPLFAKD
jgi:hypothetical protein